MDLIRSIIHELAASFPSRNGCRPNVLLAAAEFLESQLHALGLEVEPAWYSAAGIRARNLIVHQTGRDPDKGLIVVGAHYDTVLGTPGADDNASGVAGVMELARRFASARTSHPLSFVLFPNEEPPFFFGPAMRSRQYASSLRQKDLGSRS